MELETFILCIRRMEPFGALWDAHRILWNPKKKNIILPPWVKPPPPYNHVALEIQSISPEIPKYSVKIHSNQPTYI